MKEAVVSPETTVSVRDSPIPVPGKGEILIKVIVSGTNPKDWKVPAWTNESMNSGDDIAGTIAELGSNVRGFHKGDRVAAFHVMRTSGGSFAEYAIAPQHTTFTVPDSITFEEAATIPLAAYTSAVALFRVLEFRSPWDQVPKLEAKKRPLIIYGASTAVGAFAIKLAYAAEIHPVVAVGSENSKFVLPFLATDQGDKFVDYTKFKTDDELVNAIQGAVKETGAQPSQAYVLDCVSTSQTLVFLSNVVRSSQDVPSRPRMTFVLPMVDENGVNPNVDLSVTSVATVHEKAERDQLFGLVWGQAFARGLAQGWLTPHPHEVVKGGLFGLENALKGLREEKVRGKKMVVRLNETEGAK
ncbi:hypothetical protein NM208_g707 [Fusarium decemcellulare]|uniref:Uncharacterized protein n=1 Tax=Fusarium decemcellulare TaxID=57161 RepID=A0ACC1SYH0_9HYPO|nr:hypothetical protein NM208_g707 [Fusarium decemcellulare]